MEKLQKRIDFIDKSLHPVVDFTVEIDKADKKVNNQK